MLVEGWGPMLQVRGERCQAAGMESEHDGCRPFTSASRLFTPPGPTMNTCHGFLIATVLLGVACGGGAHQPSRSTPGPTAAASRDPAAEPPVAQTYAFLFTTGSNWDMSKPPQNQQGFAAHSRNLRRLRDAGIIIAGGRFGGYGLMIVEAPSEDSARAMLAPDSSLAARTFNVEVTRWATVYPGQLAR